MKILIKKKNGGGTGAPSSLEYGELATDGSGNVYVGDENNAAVAVGGGGGLTEAGPTNVTATSTTTIDTVAHADVRTAKWIIQIEDSTAGEYAASEILAIHNGTTVSYTEYAIIGDFTTYTATVDISGADLRLQITNNGSNTIAVTSGRLEVSN